MSAIFRRLRHTLRRHGHYYTTPDSVPTPSQVAQERPRVDDQRENGADDAHARRPSSTPSSLPVLCDRGPYGPGIYPKEELYWNSIMYASDVEPQMVGPRYGRVKQEIRRSPVNRNIKKWSDPADSQKPAVAPRSSRPQAPLPPPSPPRGPLVPGTREWDTFMDFPCEHSLPMYRDHEGNPHRYPPGTAVTTDVPTQVPSPPSTQVCSSTLAQSGTQTLPIGVREPAQPPRGHIHTVSAACQTEEQDQETLTWNAVLDKILNNPAVDPGMKAAVRERVQSSSTTNGSGHGDTFFVAAKEARLVPNFSYPLVGSAFYDLEETRPQALPSAEQHQQEEELPNGVSPNHYNDSSDSLYRSPTPSNWPISKDHQEETRSLPTNVPPHFVTRTSSTNSSQDTHQRPHTPTDPTPTHISTLLSSLLTPSELSLHHRVVNDESSTPSPPSTDLAPPTNALSPTPIAGRLIQKLHTIIYGLQDRITGLEDDVIPQLSAYLADKNNHISALDVEIGDLDEEVRNLRRAVDFGTHVLGGCWERECENLRTMLEIRRRRVGRRGILVRLLAKGNKDVVREQRMLESGMAEGYVVGDLSVRQVPLLGKEVDALVLMAEQNVRIIREDMEEMLGLVRECQRSAERVEVVDVEEEVW